MYDSTGGGQTCLKEGDQVVNGGFEYCGRDLFTFIPGSAWDGPTLNSTGLDTSLTAVVSDEKHTGSSSMRFVFGEGGGYMGLSPGIVSACAERNYHYSFYAKQATAGACKVSFTWGGVYSQGVNYTEMVDFGTYTPPADGSWMKFEKDIIDPTIGREFYGNQMAWNITCTGGGLANAVWLDDLSFTQTS